MFENVRTKGKITVYGAYGHTGKFIVAELVKRGLTPILSGRSLTKLTELGQAYPDLEIRPAATDDDASLDVAIAYASAVINCAGPFLDTGNSLIEAAIRNRVDYLDVAAEQMAVLGSFEKYRDAAIEAEIAVLPGVAFYGGLGDLLATAAVGDWAEVDSVRIYIALDSWHPTEGTRLTGERNTYRRYTFSNGELAFLEKPLTQKWNFAEPFGEQDMLEIPLTETILGSRHLRVNEIRNYLNLKPLSDLRDPATPPPQPDETGISPQIFLMEAVAQKGTLERRAKVSGRDIYYITAPLVVEAAERLLRSPKKIIGIAAVGEVFDAPDFLETLSSDHFHFSPNLVGKVRTAGDGGEIGS